MNRYRRHFDELCRELKVDLILVVDNDYPDDPWGYAVHHPYHRDRRAVILSHAPTAPSSYLVGLHELGHCARGPGWSGDLEMERECAAWQWCLDHYKYVPPERAARFVLLSLDRSAALPGVVKTDEYLRMRRRLQRAAR